MFGQGWDRAEATIVARDAKFSGDGEVATYTYVADVRLSSGEMFRATVHEPTIATDFWAPDIGDGVSVLVKAKDRKVKFDKDDERLSARAHQAAQQRAFENTQQQPPGTPAATGTPSVTGTSTEIPDAVAKKLAQLGIVLDGSAQVFTADSAQGQAMLSALTHSGTPVVGTPEARLRELQTLHERGLLTEQEYAEQRHRILDEL